MSEMNWEGLCQDFFSLFDAIEQANTDGESERLHTLILGRFQMMKEYGIEVERTGFQAAEVQ